MSTDTQSRLWPVLSALLLSAAVIALIMLMLPGPAYRLGLFELGTSFAMLRWAFHVGAATGILSFLGFVAARLGGRRRGSSGRMGGAFVLSAVVAASLYLIYTDARSHVPIHDVTTDLDAPPAFAIIPPRSYEPPASPRGGPADPEWRRLHEEGYGDLGPLGLDMTVTAATEASAAVARSMGWKIVAMAPQDGRLEATDTTTWFGFKDDIVVRIRPVEGGGVRVDLRSVSRVGVSDIGANASRIRAFLDRLAAQAEDS